MKYITIIKRQKLAFPQGQLILVTISKVFKNEHCGLLQDIAQTQFVHFSHLKVNDLFLIWDTENKCLIVVYYLLLRLFIVFHLTTSAHYRRGVHTIGEVFTLGL